MKLNKILCTSVLAIGLTGNAVADLTTGLVAHFPFNGNADDASGNNHHATVMGAILTTDRAGNANSAYQFNGQNDYLYGEAIDTGQDFTLSAWIFDENKVAKGHNRILFNGYNQPPNDGLNYPFFGIGVDHSTAALGGAFQANSGSDPRQAFTYPTTPLTEIALGQWYHVSMTKKSNECPKLYIDGDEIAGLYEVHNNENCTDIDFVSGEEFSIGAALQDAAHGFSGVNWQGKLDDITVYERVLSKEELKELCDKGIDYPEPDLETTNPIRDLKCLKSISIWEATGGVSEIVFSKADPKWNVETGAITSSNSDIQTNASSENYDIFYSNADSTPNLNGEFITIQGTNPQTAGGGALNIAAVGLNLSTGSTKYATYVTHFAVYGGNSIPNDVPNIIGNDFTTFTTMGSTVDNQRLSVTVGFGCDICDKEKEMATVDGNLNIHVPHAQFGTSNIWFNLNYTGANSNGAHNWTYVNHGVNP
ncbi:MAG: LamG domain-containing protein [Methylococcales bacterium]|nr:LamG domain-containing protein [Methylococcales bacterium]